MATADRILMLKLISDTSQSQKQLKGLSGTLRRSARAVGTWGKAFAGALVIGGIEKVVDSIDDALEGFREGEDAAKTLGQTWKSLGRDADQLDRVLGGLGDTALELGFDDAEVIRAFNTFLTETGSVKDSMAGVQAAMNLARARGISFARAVKIVKGSLGELGPELKRNREQARRWARNHPFQVALGKIADLWEGFVGNLSQGKLNKAFAALGGIADEIGKVIFGFDDERGRHVPGIVDQFAEVGPKIVDAILGGLTELGARIQTAWDEQIATVDWAKAIPDALSTFWRDTLQPFLTGLADKGPVAAGAITAIAVALALLVAPAIAAALPVIAIGVAVAAVTAAFVLLLEQLGPIQTFLQDVQHAFERALGVIGDLIGDLVEHANNLLELLGLVHDRAAGVNREFGGPGGRRGQRQGLGEGPNTWPRLPEHFARGGIVRRPTIGLLGESGPEAVVPLAHGGMGSITVNVYAGVGDPVAIGREVDRVLRAYRGRVGAW